MERNAAVVASGIIEGKYRRFPLLSREEKEKSVFDAALLASVRPHRALSSDTLLRVSSSSIRTSSKLTSPSSPSSLLSLSPTHHFSLHARLTASACPVVHASPASATQRSPATRTGPGVRRMRERVGERAGAGARTRGRRGRVRGTATVLVSTLSLSPPSPVAVS